MSAVGQSGKRVTGVSSTNRLGCIKAVRRSRSNGYPSTCRPVGFLETEMQHGLQKFERTDPWPSLPFDDDIYLVPSIWEALGWIFLAFCFLTLCIGFLGMA